MLKRVDHINIVTPRLEETRAFLEDVLGLVPGPRPPFQVEGYWLCAGSVPLVHIQQAHRAVGPSRESALNHVAFAADDLEPVIAALERRAVPYTVTLIPGSQERQIFFEDPTGVRIEVALG